MVETNGNDNMHWRTLEFNDGTASYFAEIAEWLAPIYPDELHTNPLWSPPRWHAIPFGG
ncbi:hypothetical protein [Mycobacterium sp.]|uniref:hypothetical protein n=1 Tax=Mycobacterium sp. TaxID=1785 RepID=UPI003F9E8629